MVVQQYRSGRSATSIARIQKISRQRVYALFEEYKEEVTINFGIIQSSG